MHRPCLAPRPALLLSGLLSVACGRGETEAVAEEVNAVKEAAASDDRAAQPKPEPAMVLELTAPPPLQPLELQSGPDSMGPRISADPVEPGAAILSWIDPGPAEGGTLRWARIDATGSIVARGEVVADARMLLNWADVPVVTRLAGESPSWFAIWPRRFEGEGHGYGLFFAHSEDGETWSTPERLHTAEHGPEFGFPSLAALEDGRLAVAWLDGRNSGGHGAPGGAMQLRSRIWPDGEERVLDERVCDCCGTDTVASPDGKRIITAYRDRSEEELRDVVVLDWAPELDTPRRDDSVATPGWKIGGCPVNGPASSMDADGKALWTASFSAADARKVEVSRVPFAGESGARKRYVVDEGAPLGRVDLVALTSGSALVSWLRRASSEGEKRAQWVARTLGPDGAAAQSTPLMTLASSRDAGFPRLQRIGDELVLLAWTEAAPGVPTRVHAATTTLEALVGTP